MPYRKRIVCLANSRKLNGRCVAGKQVEMDSYGKWIRPVSAEEKGQLSIEQIQCQDNDPPQLLDVISIPIKEYRPHNFQTENFLIDETKRWIRLRKVRSRELPLLADDVESLWLNGFSSTAGINDRIPIAIAHQEITSSLLLIKPSQLAISIAFQYDSRKVRASFRYNGQDYDFRVTDPVVERSLRQRENGEYPITRNNVYLCISLGEAYQNFTYKLVAAIINFPQE